MCVCFFGIIYRKLVSVGSVGKTYESMTPGWDGSPYMLVIRFPCIKEGLF